MIQPTQVERARKIVKQYHFDGFPIISLDYAISRIKPIMDDIEGFEPHYYDLYDVEQHYQPYGSTVYKGILQVTYLSIERDLYIFRY
nr:MAG TPA_asm: hypothetical protein [Caudoviricetes sp.]